jgi:pyruvate, water dikinase
VEVIQDLDLFRMRLNEIHNAIGEARLPENVQEEIRQWASQKEAPFGWAVRSSAVGEDGRFSFAGQFDSLLHVPHDGLLAAYQHVVKSRYQERAVMYRRSLGLQEIDTPMAVFFLPMVEARSAGVLYTRDPEGRKKDCMLVNAVWGLGQELVGGRMEADCFVLNRTTPDCVVEELIARKEYALVGKPEGYVRKVEVAPEKALRPSLDHGDLKKLWEAGQLLEQEFRVPLDIEWVVDPSGRLWIVQARPLTLQHHCTEIPHAQASAEMPLLEGGCSIQAGRAVGPAFKVEGDTPPARVPQGSILVIPLATPEIAMVLPNLAGCIAEVGNPAGHAAALLREWRVPSLFGVQGALRAVADREPIGLDATHRRVYRGVPWPELTGGEERRGPVATRPADTHPLLDRICSLTLFDPSSPRFRPEGSTSLHDIIRFVHEKAVEATFNLGDKQKGRRQSKVRRLKTEIPLNILVLDLGDGVAQGDDTKGAIEPHQITSLPFQSLWVGLADPQVSWSGRQQVSLKGFSSVLVSSFAGNDASARKLGDPNYLLVAADYMNMNLRLAYHYAMIDSLVGKNAENNFVNFRFRGGGVRVERRAFRARFLSETLRRLQFSVDRRGDLVTAWYRRYPRNRCELALAILGRLMACSRQLDMLISNEKAAHEYADRFIAGDYQAFL